MKTIYLSGPIAGCTDSEANGWRNMLSNHSLLVNEFKFIDPFKNRDFRGKLGEPKLVVEPDKAEILQSDIVIVNPWKPSFGTPMEVYFAWENKRVVITMWSRHWGTISPWLEYHSTFVMRGWNQLINYLIPVKEGQ